MLLILNRYDKTDKLTFVVDDAYMTESSRRLVHFRCFYLPPSEIIRRESNNVNHIFTKRRIEHQSSNLPTGWEREVCRKLQFKKIIHSTPTRSSKDVHTARMGNSDVTIARDYAPLSHQW